MLPKHKFRILAISWALLIYSTLYIVRPICEFLKSNTPFGVIVGLSAFAALAVILIRALRSINSPGPAALMALIITAYAAALVIIKHPEEKIHLAQYGLLAYLLYMSFEDERKSWKAYVLSFVIASFVGWIDELIQYFLPNRYYQTTDVVLNIYSAGIAIALIYVFKAKRCRAGKWS